MWVGVTLKGEREAGVEMEVQRAMLGPEQLPAFTATLFLQNKMNIEGKELFHLSASQ